MNRTQLWLGWTVLQISLLCDCVQIYDLAEAYFHIFIINLESVMFSVLSLLPLLCSFQIHKNVHTDYTNGKECYQKSKWMNFDPYSNIRVVYDY